MTPELRRHLRAVFTHRPDGPCTECGGYHLHDACPRIKRKAWHPNGNLIEIEYWPPGTWETGVLWPEDAYEEEDDGE